MSCTRGTNSAILERCQRTEVAVAQTEDVDAIVEFVRPPREVKMHILPGET